MVNKAQIGRFDGELKTVAFNEGDTISDLLRKVNITLSSGEQINDNNGNTIEDDEEAVDGESYSIVGNFKQG